MHVWQIAARRDETTAAGLPTPTRPGCPRLPRAGTAALTREDIAPALEAMKKKLMERNVAEEIAEKWALFRGGILAFWLLGRGIWLHA